MKKKSSFILIALILFGLIACKSMDYKKEILMIIDQGTIDDNAFTQGIYEGVKEYSEKNKKSFGYLEAIDKTDSGYLELIENAKKKDCKNIIFAGNLFERAVFLAQEQYPEMNFIFLDAVPKKDQVVKILQNTISITFDEDFGGYLAGYGCVVENFKRIGFLGGMDIESVRKFGYGYINGIIQATIDLQIQEEIQIYYDYNGSFMPSDSVFLKASAWYKNNEVDVIFSCAGRAISSIISSSELYRKKVIGVDIDQTPLSETVMTSVVKDLKKAVSFALEDIYSRNKENFGKSLKLEQSTKLVDNFSRFSTFNEEGYLKVFDQYDAEKRAIKNYAESFQTIKNWINSQDFKVKIQ